jgi:hypothetical protein
VLYFFNFFYKAVEYYLKDKRTLSFFKENSVFVSFHKGGNISYEKFYFVLQFESREILFD